MMIHTDRIFSSKQIEREDDLVEVMKNRKWPLCYSFHYGDLLYLNDSDSEEAPEYVVMTIDKVEGHHGINGREVGRIKPNQMDLAQVHKFIQDMKQGNYVPGNPVRIQAEPVWHHSCKHCGLGEGD